MIVFLGCCYKPSFPLFGSMARTKVTPKKEREGRTVIRSKGERVCLAKEAKKELEKAKRRRREREQARQAREEKTEKKGPPSPVHHPSPVKKSSPVREVEKELEEAERQVEEAK